MTTYLRSATLSLLAALIVLLAGCEKNKDGVLDPDLSLPVVASATVSLGVVNLDTTTSAALTRLPDGTFRISEEVACVIDHPSGAGSVSRVYAKVYRTGNERAIASVQLSRSAADSATRGRYAGEVAFSLSRAQSGLYRVEFYAQGTSGEVGNSVLLPVIVTRNNSAPHLGAITLPDSVTLPVGDSLLIKMTMAVSDSDGAGDIDAAFFYSLNSSDPSRKFFLADDGNVTGFSGDTIAGDGVYTITVKLVDSPTVRRTFQFEFHAVDRQGADSGPALHYLTVQ